MSVRAVLDQAMTAIEAMPGVGLRRASYRRPLEQEPVGGSHRRYTVELVAARISRQIFGAGETPVTFDMSVRIAYARGGGDAGGGDRRSANSLAGEDSVLVADCWSDSRNWARLTTAIREVRFVGSSMVVDAAQVVIWETRFTVEVMYPWPA